MGLYPNFPLTAADPISVALRQRGVATFAEAVAWVAALPYGRNPDKDDALALLQDGRGTCSTKHALLKRLTAAHTQPGWELCLGIFRMHAGNTPAVGPVLARHGLAYLPEAHCYLRYQGTILDATTPTAGAASFAPELLQETTLAPEQISQEKIRQHREYLASWLQQPENRGPSLEQVWQAREACIAALAG